MAAQTHGAVDSLLGLLSSAIKDEARLLGGVHGDVQFIKDEMDSMNGFLLHLTKTESAHDDQVRAWMKQVRDIAYIAEDCIELYVRDLAPLDAGLLAFLRHLPVYVWTAPARHRLATKIRELKVRVRDVGERRLRYGVTVPATPELKRAAKQPGQDEIAQEARREAFLQALDEEAVAMLRSGGLASEESRAITDLLPACLRHPSEAHTMIPAVLKKCYQDGAESSCTKMFLCALCVYPYITTQELKNLKAKLDEGADGPKELVRIFCYSMLSTPQKSCLQYLTTFLKETNISRTSLVRRWVAEGLVAKEHEMTPEEVGERCFRELVFRGFVRPDRIGDAGTVKSCVMDDSIRAFIINIAKSENFVSELPSHLERQLKIRKIVLRSLARTQQQKADGYWRNMNIHDLVLCCGGVTSRKPLEDDTTAASDNTAAASDVKDPMDDLVDFLKSLPELYRLNVLDLGGCKGLRKRHLKSICKVVSLKYLSLRNTDVYRLRPRHVQALRLLETLDIRGTDVRPGDMKRIFLPKLKHLLAGRYVTASGGDAGTARTSAELSLSTVDAPRRIGMMRYMETLCHVKVSKDGNELEGVAKLQQLRKLGVVVHVNDATAKLLRRVISGGLALRSLSIWVTVKDGDSGTLDISKLDKSFSPSSLTLENLDIVGKCNLPPWIEGVKKLKNITLRETQLKDDDLLRLGRLKGLHCLRLRGGSYTERPLLNFTAGQFEALRFLVVRGDKITSIAFAPGAAPMLEKIIWIFRSMDTEQEPLSGIASLQHLKEIELTGDHFDPLHNSNLERAVKEHPNKPKLSFRCSLSDH
ncbi:hypothetical protein BAE44_0024374 [Dichanthelium oligosanthes]|uniref:Uncharacterized protein n=1 Tax=Dichanthelium oligosanthes TaxID=888268 RepID=A0A1E5UP08_9POAL|nr:hypothetical protein BAE44_0024374 [Dichanthelium oligosanthes]